jgi:hypothetical protein
MHPSIRISCPGCSARIKAPFELLGKTRKCPRCRLPLNILTKPPKDSEPILSGEDGMAPNLSRLSELH